jgi:AcrR family transcriptional regulator
VRVDALRHRDAILTGAIGVLANRPTASMREIALACGTGRTTLYRHFPDRHALVRAIIARLLDEAVVLTARALADADDDPVEVIVDLSVELADLGDRYRFLEQDLFAGGHLGDSDLRRRRRIPLRRFLAAAQQDGRIRADLDVDWLLDVFAALVTQAASRAEHGIAVPRVALRATVRSIFAVPDKSTR